jgi:plastocyanin domain-containing protein
MARTLTAAAAAAAALLALAGGCKHATSAADVKDSVSITVDESGFKPTKIVAMKGKPITLVFNRTVEHTCADVVVIPSQNLRVELPLNASKPVTITPSASGEIHFACPMNMFGGDITVIE